MDAMINKKDWEEAYESGFKQLILDGDVLAVSESGGNVKVTSITEVGSGAIEDLDSFVAQAKAKGKKKKDDEAAIAAAASSAKAKAIAALGMTEEEFNLVWP